MPMRPSHDRPVNDPLSRMGFVRHGSIDGDVERLVVSYPGYGLQPGETPEPARRGARARSQWHQEAGVWNIRAPQFEADCSITLLKTWQLNASGDSHNHIAMHPNGLWIATVRSSGTARTLEIYDWETETLVDDIALATSVTVRHMAFSPLGNYIALATNTSPYIKVYPVDVSTGVLSAAVSDPATAATGEGDTVAWHPTQSHVFVNDALGGTDPISAWPFTTGFGGKVAAPLDVQGWGAVAGGSGNHPIFDLTTATRGATLGAQLGLAISPDGASLVTVASADGYGFLLQYQWTGTGFGVRIDSDPIFDPITNRANGIAYPEFDESGKLLALANINGELMGSTIGYGAEAYVCEFTGHGFGPVSAMPRYGVLATNGARIIRTRGPKWRPNAKHKEIMVPVTPIISAEPEVRLLMCRMDGPRFDGRCEWAPDDSDDWEMDIGAWTAWHPTGNYFLMGLGNTFTPNSDTIAVFRVT